MLEPELEGEKRGVPLGEPVPAGDPDSTAVTLADTVKVPLRVSLADAVGSRGEPVARGVEEGQAVAGTEPDCEGEGAADFVPAGAVSDCTAVAEPHIEAVGEAVSAAELAGERDTEGEADAVRGAESVNKGVNEADGVRLETIDSDGATLAVAVAALEPLGVGRALGVAHGDGVTLTDSERPPEKDGSEDSVTGAVAEAVEEAVPAAVEVGAMLAVVVGDVDANEAEGEGLGEKGAEALARPEAVSFGDPVAPREGDDREEEEGERLASIVAEGDALIDCVGGLEALARGEVEAAPLPDPPRALTEGEPDIDAKAEREMDADGDAGLLAEYAAEAVPAAADEALGAAVPELPALLEGDLKGELVTPPLPLGAASEAVGLTEPLALWDAEKEAGKGDAVTVTHALTAPDALVPPLAEATGEGEGGGERETAPVGDAVGSADAEAVSSGEGLVRSEGEGEGDAVSTAGVDEGHPDALTVGVPAADSVCAPPLLLEPALALGAPEALSLPVIDGGAEEDSVGAGDSVARGLGEMFALTVGALEGLPCAFAVALPSAVAERLGKVLLGEGCGDRDVVADDDEHGDWLPLGVSNEEGGALGEPPRGGETVPPLLAEGPTEAEAAIETLGAIVKLKAADGEAAAEAEGAQLKLTHALLVALAAVSEGLGVAQAKAVLLGDAMLLLETLAEPVSLNAAEGETAGEAEGATVPLPLPLLVSPAADSEGLGVALANAVLLADTQPLLDAATVAVPAALPLPSSDAVAQAVNDFEAAALADALCAVEKVPPDAEVGGETLGKPLGDAGKGEGVASMEELGEGLPPLVPEGAPDTTEVPVAVEALVDVNDSTGVAETLLEAPGEAESVSRAVAVGAPE